MAKVEVKLFKSKFLANGEYPVMIKVTAGGKNPFYASVGESATEAQFQGGVFTNEKKHYPALNKLLIKKIDEYEAHVIDAKNKGINVIEYLKSLKHRKNVQTISQFCQTTIDRFNTSNQETTALNYKYLKKLLSDFRGDKIAFSQVNVEFLNDFLAFVRSKKNQNDQPISPNTVYTYISKFKAIYKAAQKEGHAPKLDSPLEGWTMPKTQKGIKAKLYPHQVQQLINFNPVANTPIWHARNYYMLMIYFLGIRIANFMLLTENDILIDGEKYHLQYRMSKTTQPFKIELNDHAKELVKYYIKNFHSGFLFPILNRAEYDKAPRKRQILNYRINTVNKQMKQLGTLLGFPLKLTCHTARHTVANLVDDMRMAQMILGHSKLETTEIYKRDLDNGDLNRAAELAFSKISLAHKIEKEEEVPIFQSREEIIISGVLNVWIGKDDGNIYNDRGIKLETHILNEYLDFGIKMQVKGKI